MSYGKRLLRLESEIIMKKINNVNKNYYVFAVMTVLIGILLLCLVAQPIPAGSSSDGIKGTEVTTKSSTTTSTYITTTTTSTTTTSVTSSNTTTEETTTTTNVTTTEKPTQTTVAPTVTCIGTTVIITEPPREYIVYKARTHYIHKNTCRWCNNECVEITSTEGIECRKCTECNPNIEIETLYVEPAPKPTTATTTTNCGDYDRRLLAEIVWHEAGSNWISQYNKAKVAAGVMNRVYDGRFPNTVYGVLTQRGQFSGYWPGCCAPTQACYDAVDYYFNHTSEFNSDNSWWGDGSQNHFYYQ